MSDPIAVSRKLAEDFAADVEGYSRLMGTDLTQPAQHDYKHPAARRKPHAAAESKTSLERVAAFLLEMDKRLTAAGVMSLPMSRRYR